MLAASPTLKCVLFEQKAMIHAKTRGWLFVGLGGFFLLASILLAGAQLFTNLPAIFQLGGGLALLGTGMGYLLEIDPFVETMVTTVVASAGFGAALVGFIGMFTL